MKKMNIPFSPPDVSELEIQYVSDAMRSGWITTGPRTKLLEEKLAAWVGTSKMVCLNSQTAAAETSLRVLELVKGTKSLPCLYIYCFCIRSNSCRAKVVLVDCSMNLDRP
jgi:dTDP-4-amino-4,6-dideoxygalactose transaminase